MNLSRRVGVRTGGTVGYFSFFRQCRHSDYYPNGGYQRCIAYVQAGGGVVADSVPETEYYETVSKARAMLSAIALAEQGFLL